MKIARVGITAHTQLQAVGVLQIYLFPTFPAGAEVQLSPSFKFLHIYLARNGLGLGAAVYGTTLYVFSTDDAPLLPLVYVTNDGFTWSSKNYVQPAPSTYACIHFC